MAVTLKKTKVQDLSVMLKSIFTPASLKGIPYLERDKSRMHRLLEKMGNPQLLPSGEPRFRVVHVAGTNGKGHTTAIVANVLSFLGYRTGLYTSPHLHTVRERIRVDGKLISKEEFVDLCERLFPLFREVGDDVTAFDKLTALAVQHFADRNVDWAVLEVGMGGRLDSTNALSEKNVAVSGINTIGLEHQHILGSTLEEISKEKAGIMKPKVPAFTVYQRSDDVLPVLGATARSVGAPLSIVHPLSTQAIHQAVATDSYSNVCRVVPYKLPSASILSGPRHHIHQPEFWPSEHDYAATNRGLAAAMLLSLSERGLVHADAKSIVSGLEKPCYWPGRFEILQCDGKGKRNNKTDVSFLFDCAHNTDATRALLERFSEYCQEEGIESVYVLGGVNSDKAVSAMIRLWLSFPHLKGVVCSRSRHPKAMIPSDLADMITAEHKSLLSLHREGSTGSLLQCPIEDLDVKFDDPIGVALNRISSKARRGSEKSVIVVTGSVFLVAEGREALDREFPAVFPGDDFVHESLSEPDVNSFVRS